MSKFRKRPIIVEAFQWPSNDPPEWWKDALSIEDGCATGNAREHGRLFGGLGETHALVATLEGTMRINQGDWVICGVKKEIYPCKPDIFKITYELIND